MSSRQVSYWRVCNRTAHLRRATGGTGVWCGAASLPATKSEKYRCPRDYPPGVRKHPRADTNSRLVQSHGIVSYLVRCCPRWRCHDGTDAGPSRTNPAFLGRDSGRVLLAAIHPVSRPRRKSSTELGTCRERRSPKATLMRLLTKPELLSHLSIYAKIARDGRAFQTRVDICDDGPTDKSAEAQYLPRTIPILRFRGLKLPKGTAELSHHGARPFSFRHFPS